MNNTSLRIPLLVVALAALAGCVTHTTIVEPGTVPEIVVPETPSDRHYEPVASRSPEMIASLRAAPPPAQPELVEGRNAIGDQRTLSARGYVQIGSARYEVDDASAQAKALEIGTEVGADQMLVYRNDRPEAQAHEQFLAVYYVRLKLLFGASFRNLTTREKETLEGATGVEIGSVVGGTPASQANLMAGDLVLAFNGRPFRDRAEFQELLRGEAGKPVTLTIRRGDVTMDRMVRLGAMPAEPAGGSR